MVNDAVVAGVGMIPFVKPGRGAVYAEMGSSAARAALEDAGIDYAQVQQAYVGYVYGDSASGQAAAGCCRKVIPWAPPVWRSAPNWCGSCAGKPEHVRSTASPLPCNTTSASAAPAS